MYYKRKLEDTILNYLDKREILAIVGPRQSGKTTLLRKIQGDLADSIFLTFEDIGDLALFEEDIKGFVQKYLNNYKYIFIDEFQYSKKGGKNLKYLFDTFPENKIIISGSSAIDLTIRAIKFLVGRVFVFNLHLLDFAEFLDFEKSELGPLYLEYSRNIDLLSGQFKTIKIAGELKGQFDKLLKEFIVWGGYPRVVLADSAAEKQVVLKNIYNTYFLRDIKDTLGLVDDFKLAKLIKALALRIGQLISYQELSQLSGYDYLSLKKFLNILEKTFICAPIRPFFRNKTKEIVKNPKVYFFDTGMRNCVLSDFTDLGERIDEGVLYENFVFCQLIKKEIKINFWRTKAGVEVDFILDLKPGKLPLEVKSAGKQSSIRPIELFSEEHQAQAGVLLGREFEETLIKGGNKIYFLAHWII